MPSVNPCHWSQTGYCYANPDGSHSCRVAAPPGVVMYEGELAALEHERDVIIATSLEYEDTLADLEESVPPDYARMLAAAYAKIASANVAWPQENANG